MISRLGRALVGTTGGRVALAVVAVVVVVVAALALRGGGDDDGPTATSHPVATDPLAPPSGLRFWPDEDDVGGDPAPLTGLRVADEQVLGRPALAIKVDNLDVPGETARPQAGLVQADVVVEEVVEGGITRFVTVLHSTDAEDVGPVRSARTTDVHLLPFLGRPLFAYSGANGGVQAALRDAPAIVDRGGEWAPAFHRVEGRRPPHDLFVRPPAVWERPGDAGPPPPLADFVPLDAEAPDGDPAAGVDLRLEGMGAVPVRWRWSVPDERWVRHQGDEVHLDDQGYAVGPRNVVVLDTTYRPSPADARSPEAVTVGSGDALVLTRGVVVAARWERPSEADGFRLTDGSGEPIALSVGRTWIELVEPGTAEVVR